MDATLRDRAIDQAYRDHATEVYRVAYGILRDADEAVDATHDAFARAWERWDQYDSQRPLRAWLHGIVVHQALDRLRRQRVRRLALPGLKAAATGPLGTPSAPDHATDVVRRHVVEDALGTLRPEARAVLVLRHYYGYDYAAIAGYLGISSGTVGSTLSRAHAELRRRLGGPEVGLEPERPRRPGASPTVADVSAKPPEVR